MASDYVYIADVRERARVPENGILSQTLHDDGKTKAILFGFAPGQELSAHTAPFPATLAFFRGEATLTLGGQTEEATEGTYVSMPAFMEHGIRAKTDVVMLLTMMKSAAPPKP